MMKITYDGHELKAPSLVKFEFKDIDEASKAFNILAKSVRGVLRVAFATYASGYYVVNKRGRNKLVSFRRFQK